MKIKTFLLVCCLSVLSLSAAVPGSFMMQAVATDGESVTVNKEMTVRVSIRQGSSSSKAIYQETHEVVSDALGVITMRVGEGKPATGDFASINWAGQDSYIEVEVDKGSGFVSTGVQQIAAVPYAKVAEKAETLMLVSASGKKFNVNIDDEGNLIATPVAE